MVSIMEQGYAITVQIIAELEPTSWDMLPKFETMGVNPLWVAPA
jgi:hypothetical protein